MTFSCAGERGENASALLCDLHSASYCVHFSIDSASVVSKILGVLPVCSVVDGIGV